MVILFSAEGNKMSNFLPLLHLVALSMIRIPKKYQLKHSTFDTHMKSVFATQHRQIPKPQR